MEDMREGGRWGGGREGGDRASTSSSRRRSLQRSSLSPPPARFTRIMCLQQVSDIEREDGGRCEKGTGEQQLFSLPLLPPSSLLWSSLFAFPRLQLPPSSEHDTYPSVTPAGMLSVTVRCLISVPTFAVNDTCFSHPCGRISALVRRFVLAHLRREPVCSLAFPARLSEALSLSACCVGTEVQPGEALGGTSEKVSADDQSED